MDIKTAIDISKKQIVLDGHMVTASGWVVDLFNPDKSIITLEDIAHGLAFTCRWNGATKTYFSVAEHCCMMYDMAVDKDHKLTALFHDAEEAYWGDIISPIKKLLAQEIRTAMEDFRTAIFKKFGVKPIDDYINQLDKNLLEWDLENLIKQNTYVAMSWDCYTAKTQWLKKAIEILV